MINRDNYKDIQHYLEYHRRSLQNSYSTVRAYENQLKHALIWCDSIPFPTYTKAKKTFPEYLNGLIAENKLSPRVASDICMLFRDFLHFEIRENKSAYGKIKESQINEIRIITHSDSTKTAEYYTLDEMEKIANYKPKTLAMKRTKASACFLYLSGMRISAFMSLPIECFDIGSKAVYQYPDMGVVTKFSKKAITTLLNIPVLFDVVREWHDYLIKNKIPSNSLWYAGIDENGRGEMLTAKYPIKNNHDKAYATASHKGSLFRSYLKKLCQLAEIEYKSPHAFRHGHIHFGLSHATTLEQAKAISQNAMHNSTAITDEIYSRMNYKGVSSVIAGLGSHPIPSETKQSNNLILSEMISGLSDEDKKVLIKELLGL